MTTLTHWLMILFSLFREAGNGRGLPRAYQKKVIKRQDTLLRDLEAIQDAVLRFKFEHSQICLKKFLAAYRAHSNVFEGTTYSLVSKAKTETYRVRLNSCDIKVKLACEKWLDKTIESRDLGDLLISLDAINEQLVSRFKWETNYLRELYQNEAIAYSSQTVLN